MISDPIPYAFLLRNERRHQISLFHFNKPPVVIENIMYVADFVTINVTFLLRFHCAEEYLFVVSMLTKFNISFCFFYLVSIRILAHLQMRAISS